jgi:hypothetical protein
MAHGAGLGRPVDAESVVDLLKLELHSLLG